MLRIHNSDLNEENPPYLDIAGDYMNIDEMKNIIQNSEIKTIQERMRRKQLAQRMEELKKLISAEQNLSSKESKSTIVQKAIKYIEDLKVENKELEIKKLELQTKHQELQDTLYLLNLNENGDDKIMARDWEDTPMYVCDFTVDCCFTSDDADIMFQHEQEYHFLGEGGNHHKCDNPGCNQRYFSSRALIEHKKAHERKVKKACSKASVANVSLLKNHEIFKCYEKFCSQTFVSYEQYKTHVFEHKRCQEIRSAWFNNQNSVEQKKKSRKNNSYLNEEYENAELFESDDNKTPRVVYRCEKPLGKGKYCNKIFLNEEVMRVHDFIHEDLMLFACPIYKCDYVYGLPSKVENHVQLYHFNSVNRIEIFRVEELKPLDIEARKLLNCRMQEAFATISTSSHDMVFLMNNFLEAVIDAKMMMDEVKAEVEQTQFDELSKGLEVRPAGPTKYFQHQNIKFVEKNNVISRLDLDENTKNLHKSLTDFDIEDMVVKIEPDHIEDMVVEIEPDQETVSSFEEDNLTFEEKEPTIEIDGVVTSTISDIPHESRDDLDKDVIISIV